MRDGTHGPDALQRLVKIARIAGELTPAAGEALVAMPGLGVRIRGNIIELFGMVVAVLHTLLKGTLIHSECGFD